MSDQTRKEIKVSYLNSAIHQLDGVASSLLNASCLNQDGLGVEYKLASQAMALQSQVKKLAANLRVEIANGQ